MTPRALHALGEMIEIGEVDRATAMIAEFLDYLRWLANQDTGRKLTVGDLWALYFEGVRIGRHWSEVCADLELPIREDWVKP
jgi:hypothetical protein